MEANQDKIYKHRWAILFNVVIVTFMCCLDSSIVNVALPVMANRLNVSMADIEWVVTSYLMMISAAILIFGRLGDIKGKSTVFKFGIFLFTTGSLLCGFSKSLTILVISRVIQAIGAGATMSTSQGIITQVFPKSERGRALGISGTFVALGTMVGPPLGGFMVSLFSWEYIFLINVPIGVIAILAGSKILPKVSTVSKEKLDVKGSILSSMAIIFLFASLIFGQRFGYGNIIIILGFIISLGSFICFIFIERSVDTPLLQLNIFKNTLFSLSIFCAFISFTSIGSSNIIQPFYLQNVRKLSPGITGLFMMVYPLILSFVAPISGYLSDRIGSEGLTFIGLVLTSIGLFLMSTLNENTNLWMLVLFLAVMAMGNGLFQSPNNSLVMSTVSNEKLGIAGSINALVRNLGMAVGVSLSTALLYNRMSYKAGYLVVSYIEGRNDIFIYGMTWVYIVASIICSVGAMLTAFRLYNRKKTLK